MRNYILVLFSSLLCSGNILCQIHQPVFPDMEGIELIDATIDAFKPAQVLNYARARDTMFGKIYKVKDSITCIYSGHQLFLPGGVDPSKFLYMDGSTDGINAEHVFPQSKGADEDNGNPHSDLHHIFPVRARVNSARANFPFRDIPDTETTSWYFKTQINSQPPSFNIDLYSERINGSFEPPESQKGNIARAMFYFYTMYRQEADDADPDFFENQREILCDWHQQDPTDSLEWERTYMIAEYQDFKPNPFVLDCSLAARIFCPKIAENCSNIVSANESILKTGAELTVFPNPATDHINIKYTTAEPSQGNFNLFNTIGQKIYSSGVRNLSKGENIISLPVAGSGFVILETELITPNGKEWSRRKILLTNR